MTSLEPILLGFDIRVCPEDSRALWSRGRREQFLLTPDIQHPLSADAYVWPSVFRYPGHFPETSLLQSISTVSAPPEYTENHLWLRLAEMRECYAGAAGGRAGRGVEIGIELFANPGLTLDQFPSPLLYKKKVPTKLPESALILGFDVATTALISGLSNTDYTPQDKERLQAKWSQKLNDHGLLYSLDDAEGFQAITNERDARDAPYWIYRLSRLT